MAFTATPPVPFSHFFFSSRRRHTRCYRDWSSDVCSSDLQGLVGAASRSKAIGAIEEVGFIDGAQDLGHRALDDFIFQREDAERPLTAVSLWDVRPANRQRPISAAMDPVGQIAKITFELLPVG